MSFILSALKFVNFRPKIKFVKFERHSYGRWHLLLLLACIFLMLVTQWASLFPHFCKGLNCTLTLNERI